MTEQKPPVDRRRRTTDPEALTLLASLDRLTAEEADAQRRLDEILETRNATFLRLNQLGVTYTQIGEHTAIKPVAIQAAVARMDR